MFYKCEKSDWIWYQILEKQAIFQLESWAIILICKDLQSMQKIIIIFGKKYFLVHSIMARKRVPSLFNLFIFYLLPSVILFHSRIHIFHYVKVEFCLCVYGHCMKQVVGWYGSDFLCKKNSYSGNV